MSVWKTLSLTCVEYPEDDILGFFLALLSLTPLFAIFVFLTFFFCRRDLHTATFGIGVLLNEAFNSLLKRLIRQERPIRHQTRTSTWGHYGMPSSHSQFTWFISTYLIFFILFRLHRGVSRGDLFWKSSLLLLSIILSFFVSVSRVYLEYHTLSQVFVGGVIGAFGAVLWFQLTQRILSPLFPRIASWKISEYCLIRDTTCIPNILWFEYTSSRSEAQCRLKKAGSRRKH